MNMNFDDYGGRRFLLALVSCITSTVLQWWGKLDPAGSSYTLLILGTLGAYIGPSTFQRVKGAQDGYTLRVESQRQSKVEASKKLPRGNEDDDSNDRRMD